MVAKHRGKRTLILEGGAKGNSAMEVEAREAFHRLQEDAGLSGRRARVCLAGGRQAAFERFCTELAKSADGDMVILLVDAEEVVQASSRWQHVLQRVGDGWARPAGATEDNLHFMAVVMETWMLADPAALGSVFGARFDKAKIPTWPDIEHVPKGTIYRVMEDATSAQSGGRLAYGKGAHSFKVMKQVNVRTLEARCPSARALFDFLRRE